MPRAYFVSDLHLTAPGDPRSRTFLRFLRELRTGESASHLFLLGDIFDLWLGAHRYFYERYQEIVDTLRQLAAEGVEIHYFEGNHDLHLAPFWGRQPGIQVHSGPLEMDLYGRRLRLEHGDQMDPDDRGYLFLRWFLRTAAMRCLILHLPGRVVAAIGERASAHSRTYTSESKTISEEDAVGKIRRHAAMRREQAPFDLIVSGHVHVRDDTEIRTAAGSARSINLGSWLDRPCCLAVDADTVELIELTDDAMAQSLNPEKASPS